MVLHLDLSLGPTSGHSMLCQIKLFGAIALAVLERNSLPADADANVCNLFHSQWVGRNAGGETGRESCGHGLDLNVIAEALDFGDEAFDLIWLGAALEVTGAEVLIERAVCDHVVGGC